MKIYSIILIFLSVSACTTSKKINFDISSYPEIRSDMAYLNQTLRGNLIRNEFEGNLSEFDKDDYLKFAPLKAEKSQVEYIEFLMNSNPEIVIVSGKRNFVVCIRSLPFKKVFCDNPETGMPDFESNDLDLDLTVKATELLQNGIKK